ncbi:MAG: hypothetical protein ACJ8HU_10370 [Chthoniobacterales bacterium]
MNAIRRWLPRALFESFLIILSILVALAVNEWREHRARLSRVAEARAVFVHEIESNRDLLRSADYLPHHERLQKEYKQLTDRASTEPGSLFDTGVHPAPLRDAAWRSFSASQTLADFAPAEMLLLSGIYRAQENVAQLNSNFLSQMTAPRSDRETPEYQRDQARSIWLFLNDVVTSEQRLLEEYDRAIAELKTR